MGSGNNNRKKSDSVLIKRPKATATAAGGSVGAGEPADVCIPSFEVKVEKSSLTHAGAPVRLAAGLPHWKMYIGSNELGKLSAELSEMIYKCSSWGIHYSGKIVMKNKSPYARFLRVLRKPVQ